MAPVPANNRFMRRLVSRAFSHTPDLQTWIIFITAIALVAVWRVVSRKRQQQKPLEPSIEIKQPPCPDPDPYFRYLPPPPGAAAMTHPYHPDFFPILTSGHLATKAAREQARHDMSSEDVVVPSATPWRRQFHTQTATTTNSTMMDNNPSSSDPPRPPTTSSSISATAAAPSDPVTTAWPALAMDPRPEPLHADTTLYFLDPDLNGMWRRRGLEFEG